MISILSYDATSSFTMMIALSSFLLSIIGIYISIRSLTHQRITIEERILNVILPFYWKYYDAFTPINKRDYEISYAECHEFLLQINVLYPAIQNAITHKRARMYRSLINQIILLDHDLKKNDKVHTKSKMMVIIATIQKLCSIPQ